ncbi:MAG: hypothetical protein HC915_21015 [Anaerolineae bacterium]|nr:hypothetical protein [Anaerolineae bacterium]
MNAPRLVGVGLLMLGSLACGVLNDVQDAVQTVSRSVELLQEIDESGTWRYIGDGLNALDTQPGGYALTITLTEGTTNDTGDTLLEVTERIIWEASVDEQGDTRIRATRGDEVREYLSVQEGNQQRTYRIEGGNYICLSSGDGTTANEDEVLFAASVDEAFLTYSLLSAGVQVMSVAQADGTDTVSEVATERFTLISKLPEAIEILADFPSEELRQSLEDIPEFYIAGSLHVAQQSRALMRLDSTYADLETKEGNQFAYLVNELGNQPDHTPPDPAQVTQPCQEAQQGQN